MIYNSNKATASHKRELQDLVQRDNKVVSLDLNANENGGLLLSMEVKWYFSSIYQCQTGKKEKKGKQKEHLKPDRDQKHMEEYLFLSKLWANNGQLDRAVTIIRALT